MTNCNLHPIKVISVKSYAKVNHYLEILDKRNDGFHNIRTIISKIDLFDELTFSLTKNGGVTVWCDVELGLIEDNLVYKAAKMIHNKYATNKSVEIKLKKNIPVQAGLAGGSSNAATTIMSLSELWDLNLSRLEMEDIGAAIGSDVNFFLGSVSALLEGRGEQVTEIDDIMIDNMLLVKPEFGIPTAYAYSLVTEYGDDDSWISLLTSNEPQYCFNRFDKPIREQYPVINGIMTYMENNGALNTIVSGSGSTVIGYYDDGKLLDEHLRYFDETNMWIYKAKTLRRTI